MWFAACPLAVIVALGTTPDDPQRKSDPTEIARQQGTWQVTSFVRDGQAAGEEITRSILRVVEGDHVVWKRDGKNFAGTKVVLNARVQPHAIDVLPDGGPSFGKRVLGIYKLDGDELTICMADPDQPRPQAFQADQGSGQTLMTFRRARPGP
jgi:uncharacterized protein (TIGR03067 family)